MNDKTTLGTLLIVEDEIIGLEILSQFLRKKGLSVSIARSGKESLQLIERAHPDLILLDVMMPGMSGFDVCQRLKASESTQDIPIIFMTARTQTVDKVKGFKLGAADYITKPFQYDELLARVKAHLSIRKLQLELIQQNQLLKTEISRSQKLETARQTTHQLLKHALTSQENGTEFECQKKLDTFVHTVTNELKKPLNTIVALNTRLQKECSSNRLRLDAQSTKTFQQLGETGQLAANIVDALVLLAGLFREEQVELELFDMSDIITKVVEERLAYMIKQYQAKIKLASVWPTIPGYGPWLNEIWMNYISNGLKHGGKPPHLELGATPENRDMIRFWVRDNGIGLTEADIAKLFTPTDQRSIHAKGDGLGLSIVRQLVEKQGGQVGVESTKGQGSLFYFTLPAYR